jgi:hypothetical protein
MQRPKSTSVGFSDFLREWRRKIQLKTLTGVDGEELKNATGVDGERARI